MKYLALILLLLFTGCYSTYDIVEDKLPLKQIGHEEHKTVDSILKYYFTDEAYEAIKDIPMVDGLASSPYVVGVNVWSTTISVLLGNGYDRKVIMPEDSMKRWGITGIIHEYIHHLDDMDRDGEGEWIDHDEFVEAWEALRGDFTHLGMRSYVENRANHWFTNLFGVGQYSEWIAYAGGYMITHKSPDYMQWVFRKILRAK